MNPLLEQFLQEARENLKFIEQNLEELGNNDSEMMNAIFRAAHTLKGGSGIVGFESIMHITHKAEDLLDQLRSNKLEYKESMLDALYDAFDEVLNLVDAAEESGDVVSGDEEVSSRILAYLNEMMGVDQSEEEKFVLPPSFCENLDEIFNFESLSFSKLKTPLEFDMVEIDSENFQDKRVYSIFFDIDKDCMAFGNDPIYALSLLEDKLLSIATTISRDDATTVVSNADDNMELYLKITALVYATYEEIEDALYNFIDDIVLYPITISSSLISNKYESVKVPFLKEFSQNMLSLLHSKNTQEIKEKISQSLELINSKTQEFVILKRLLIIFDSISCDDYPKLEPFFANISGEEITFTPDELESSPEIKELPVEDKKESIELDSSSSRVNQEIISLILSQQCEQLQYLGDENSTKRVLAIVKKCFNVMGKDFTLDSEDRDSLLKKISEIYDHDIKIKADKKEIPKDEPKKDDNTTSKKSTSSTRRKPKEETKKDVVGKVVKVEQASIDKLMSVVGEILVAKNSLPYLAEAVDHQSAEVTKRAILEKYSFIDRLTNQLQDLTMSMRMLPISYVFDRYPKLVREISKKLGKKVKLVQTGGDTKLDKNMIEMLADPLIHIVRNSLDHGIESPNVRKERGKLESGEIIMNAYPQSDQVIIEIIDDGNGIDAQRVVNKVLENNLIDVEKLDTMNDQEKLNLIMLPGLSTTDEISEYSGRGVGMDVVRKSIESFGGTILLESEMGKGTKIIMSIPVSLAVTTLLHVSMNGMNYGFPMENVNETVKVSKDSVTKLNNEYYVYIRGVIIPLIAIGDMIDIDSLDMESISLVVLNIRGNQIAVVVNDLLGQLDVVQKPMKGLLSNHPMIGGTALLGNGSIIMIIDPTSLWEVSDSINSNLILENVMN